MNNLLKLRKERNLSTREISEVFKVSKSTYNNWETGVAEPDIAKIKQLADFFCVTIDYLLGFSAKQPSPAGLNDKEAEIIKNYRLSNDVGKTAIEITAESFARKATSISKEHRA